MATILLRAETKPFEKRTPLTPNYTEELLGRGFKVIIEKSSERIFTDKEYAAAGCTMAAPGTWKTLPKSDDCYVLGIKALPNESTPLHQNHIYFAHLYKGQAGAECVLQRFANGNGNLYDLEYLTDEHGRRISAFGWWSGYAGAAVSILTWCFQKQGITKPYPLPHHMANKQALLSLIGKELAKVGKTPSILVVGAFGRCGRGARACLKDLSLNVEIWGRGKSESEFKENEEFARQKIASHNIFLNCAFIDKKIPAFVTMSSIQGDLRALNIIGDISCDPTGPNNPIELTGYNDCTTFDQPTLSVVEGDNPLEITSIDHLPTFVPKESSEKFCEDLFPHLLDLLQGKYENTPWQRSRASNKAP